jgi:predicted metalloprotease
VGVWLVAALAVVLATGGCGRGLPDVAGGRSAGTANRARPGKTTYEANVDNKVIKAAIADVDAFWAREFPRLYPGQKWNRLPAGNTYPYGPKDPPPKCGGKGKAEYKNVARNAFYCAPGDFVAWDHGALTPLLLKQFGPFTLGIVVAHEMGHRVQAKHGILDGRFIPFVTEQQADCFAGAWTRHVIDGGSKDFTITLADLDGAIGGFLAIRDPTGTSPVDPRAHGSAFQRITAFEDGLKQGPARCKTYEDGAINFVPETFNDQAEAATGGNLPVDQTETAVVQNLTAFWKVALPVFGKPWSDPKINAFDPARGVACDGTTLKGDRALGLYFYCKNDDSLNWDDVRLMPAVHDQIGDLAEGTIIATLFSVRAENVAGLPTGTLAANLEADCFTGVWAATAKTGELSQSIAPNAQLTLSPGDLDEAVATLLQFGRKSLVLPPPPSAPVGSGFLRVDAFHDGFLAAFTQGMTTGLAKCTEKAKRVAG